jgi:rubrerythrin
MSFDRWHPLDGNMIAADEHYAEAKDEVEEGECPECGEEMDNDDDGAFCPHCGYEE